MSSALQSDFSQARSAFKAYDIRGTAFTTDGTSPALTPQLFFAIGRQVKDLFPNIQQPCICIGHDTRATSPVLTSALLAGLAASNIKPFFIGLTTTPMLLWTERHQKADGALMITGSHTPPTYNGLKISIGGKPFFGQQLQQLFDTLKPAPTSLGTSSFAAPSALKHDATATYTQDLLARFGPMPEHIVWDFGNGASTVLYPLLKKALPPSHTFLHTTPLPQPQRPFDPTAPKALSVLQETVMQKKAQCGLAFDGDGDRLVVVDNMGNVWSGDETGLFFALHQDSTSPYVVDSKTSPFLLQQLRNKRPTHTTRTGHVFVRTAMHNHKASLGSEVSGHFFFGAPYYGFDDGFYAALMFLSFISAHDINTGSWRKTLPQRYTSQEYRLPCSFEEQQSQLKALESFARQQNSNICTQDGLRVTSETNWWIVRPSQTEPVLVLRWETRNATEFQNLGNFFLKFIPQLSKVWP